VPGDAFLALELLPGALKNVRGRVKYSPAFDSVL
jgi:predicted N-acetyltransferase YhbS